MKAILCRAFGPTDSLIVGDVDPPVPGADEIRIRIHAAGVNFPDILIVEGKYQFRPEFPFSPGAECAGEVIEVGRDVRDLTPGDRVMAPVGHGAFAEEVCAPADTAVKLPDHLDYRTAATLLLTYGTSAHALIQRAGLAAGETLLVHGAAGGVGLAAVEIGKALGSRVIATAGTDAKLTFARDHGADHGINYSSGPFKDQVRALTDGRGADVIYDPVGGDVFDQSLRCINWNGRLLVIGFASGTIPSMPANLPLLKGCAIVGVFWGAWIRREPAAHRRNMERLLAWQADGVIRPHVELSVPLAGVPDALRALRNREIRGKAVVLVRED